MPAYKEMDPEVVRKLLEGHTDVLTPEAQKEQSIFRNSPCPLCKSYASNSQINPQRPWTPGSVLPNKILVCLQCNAEWDPFTGLILKTSAPR